MARRGCCSGARPRSSTEALKRGAAAFRRVVFPLLAMLLLVAGRAALAHWHSTNLLGVAIPLFGALAGIRFAVYLLRLGFTHSGWLEAFERSIATLVWVGARAAPHGPAAGDRATGCRKSSSRRASTACRSGRC